MAKYTMVLVSIVVSLLGLLRGFLLPGPRDFAIMRKEMEEIVDTEVARVNFLFSAQEREMEMVTRRREELLKELENFDEIIHQYAQQLTDLQEVAINMAANDRFAAEDKCIPLDLVLEETELALHKISADGTGMADFANIAVGGTVLKTQGMTSRTYTPRTWWMSSNIIHWFGFDNGIGPVESVISSISSPGRCWAMQGSTGQVSIQLAREIGISSFSIEHSLRSSAAARDFEVYGLRGHEAPVKLLEGSYDLDGPSIQTFPTETTTDRFSVVQFRIMNNWGNPETTCIYRLRVHGEQ